MSLKTNVFILFLIFNLIKVNGQGINGVCFVSPSNKTVFSNFHSLKRIEANWLAVVPYAVSKANETYVRFDDSKRYSWWGENSKGVITMLQQAKTEKLKVMLKPHIWVLGHGWCGQYDLDSEEKWKEWEKNYARYIIHYARIAEQCNVELLCIGTEYKIAATKREGFWRELIKSVRKIYHGKVVYAANWDNYYNIKFWDALDYVGVDAYFPLSNSKDATKSELDIAWKKVVKELSTFSNQQRKKIIFTEYGYKSIHFSTWNQWEVENVGKTKNVNLSAQENGYSSLFENIWQQPWFEGGFLWKWYANDKKSGGINNSDYTPQHKPVESIIKRYYHPN